MALWRVAREAVIVGIGEEGDIAMVVLQAAQCPSCHGPCLRGAEQVAKGLKYCGMAVAPMWSVAQGGGHWNGVTLEKCSPVFLIGGLIDPVLERAIAVNDGGGHVFKKELQILHHVFLV